MGDSKKYGKYKIGDEYYNLCMEKKLAITSYYNPNELLHQKLEILNVCRHKESWLFGK